MTSNTQIVVVGLGQMGLAFSVNLAQAGFSVTGLDPYASDATLARLESEGGTPTRDLAAAFSSQPDVLISSLPDSAVVSGFYDTLVANDLLQGSCTWLEMSTAEPAATRDLADRVSAESSWTLIDAPVCAGGVGGAWAGTLTLAVGAPSASTEPVGEVLSCLASDVVHAGEIGQGHELKLLSNLIAMGTRAFVAEAYALGESFGFSRDEITAHLSRCGAGKMLDLAGSESVPVVDPPAFRTDLAAKDLGYALNAARDAGISTPISAAMHQAYLLAVSFGLGDYEGPNAPKRVTELLAVARSSS